MLTSYFDYGVNHISYILNKDGLRNNEQLKGLESQMLSDTA